MGINSPGDYLVHHPAGDYVAAPLQPPTQTADQQLQAAPAKSRGLSWKRLVSFRRR